MEMFATNLKEDGRAMNGERYLGMVVKAYYAEYIVGDITADSFATHWSTLPKHRNPIRLFDENQIKDINNLRHILRELGYAIVPTEPCEKVLRAMDMAYSQKMYDMTSPTPTEEYEAGGGPWGYAYNAVVNFKEGE